MLCLIALGETAPVRAHPGHGPDNPEEEKGGILRMVTEAPLTLDPVDSDSVYESLPLNQIFDGLVDVDPTMHILPALASDWVVSRDGKTYTFKLRPGVRFHDGSLLTVDDVVFTIRRLLEPKNRHRSLAASYLSVIEGADAYSRGRTPELAGVAALDARTVRIRLEHPYGSFLEVLAMDGLKIVPKAVLERV